MSQSYNFPDWFVTGRCYRRGNEGTSFQDKCLSPEPYKKSCNMFFSICLYGKSDTSYIGLCEFMAYFNCELNNSGWFPDSCSSFFILWTTISKYWLFTIKMWNYCLSIPWKFQQHWAGIVVWLFLSLMVFNFIVYMFTVFLVMSLLTHQGWLFVKEMEMISSSVYLSHYKWWGLWRCL